MDYESAFARMKFADGTEITVERSFEAVTAPLMKAVVDRFGGRHGVLHLRFTAHDGKTDVVDIHVLPKISTEFSTVSINFANAVEMYLGVGRAFVRGPDLKYVEITEITSFGEYNGNRVDPSAIDSPVTRASSDRYMPPVDPATGVRDEF